jgi:methylase of polypeptide subunit release factors
VTQLSIVEAGPACDPERAQWLTPMSLAREIVSLARTLLDDATRRGYPVRVLEPSAGRGNLVRAVRERCPSAIIDAVELDERWSEDLLPHASGVEIADYLARPAPNRRYDLIVSNPPFDGGQEVDHVAKMLDEGERVLLLLPSRSLHGGERYRRIWQRMGRDWWLRQQVHCVSRPRFGQHGGTDEIVLLDLRRTPGDCAVRWS